MAKRDRYYEKFGPKGWEATINILLQEINRLRVEIGLSERTKEQMLDALEAEYATLPNYAFEEPSPLEGQ